MTTIDPILAAALVIAQKNAKSAFKTKKHEHFNFMYVPADEVVIVGRQALNDVGLALIPLAEDFEVIAPIDDKCGGAVAVVRCKWLVIHESGATYQFTTDVPVVPERGRSSGWSRPADKACFGSRTEALGYAYRDLLSIPREDAPDVSGSGGKGKAGPGTEQEQQQRQDARANPRKSADQYLSDMRAAEKFKSLLETLSLARRDVATPERMAEIENVFADRFVTKIEKLDTPEAVDKDAGLAARLALRDNAGAKVSTAIDAARIRVGAAAQ